MHLDLPTPTLLAGLPHLLAPPPAGKVAFWNDLVGISVAIALSLQAIFGVIHVFFVTHQEGRRCKSNTAHFRRGGFSCKSTMWKQRAWGGYLIGDPHVPGDDTLAPAGTWHVTYFRICSHNLQAEHYSIMILLYILRSLKGVAYKVG
jgi:hypothetical protein